MLVASRMPPRFWKRWAWPALLAGGALQLLVFVPGLGVGDYNRNWLSIAGFTMQPSEFVKIALVVWVAWVLSAKEEMLDDWKHVALPIAPVAGVAVGFVLLGNDLGTAAIMIMLVFGCCYFAGVRLRFLAVAAVAVSAVALLFAFTSDSRASRIMTWLEGCTPQDYQNYCWQVEHGLWALAAGGVFGVGLGNSKAKWTWLPEADNDYIFAIIGEELGLDRRDGRARALRACSRSRSCASSARRATASPASPWAAVMVWIIGQAFVNIAVVLGVLPVLGVPLPLISAGGSALIATLLGIGVVLSFARNGGDLQEPTPAGAPRGVRSRA